jgi:hypothetical protein
MLQAGAVGDGIDPKGKSADDHQAFFHELLNQQLRGAFSVLRVAAGAHDRDAVLFKNAGIAAHEKNRRRRVDFPEMRGIVGVGQRENADIELSGALYLVFGSSEERRLVDGRFFARGRGERIGKLPERGFGAAEFLEKGAYFYGA